MRDIGTGDEDSFSAICAILARNVNLASLPLGRFSDNRADNWRVSPMLISV